MAKVNAEKGKVKIEDLVSLPLTRAERRRITRAERKDGKHLLASPLTEVLSEAEKVQLVVLIEKVNTLQAQLQQVQLGLSGLIGSIVGQRGLDPKKFGVNLAAGKILPIDAPSNEGVKQE